MPKPIAEKIINGGRICDGHCATDECVCAQPTSKPNGWEDLEIYIDEMYSLAWQDGNEGLNRRAKWNKDFQHKLHQAILSAEERAREEVKEMVFGELGRSELQAVVESMGRQFGHTYSAVNGVKNNKNSRLVIVHRHQESSIDLPREQLITLEDIKMGKMRGKKTALVMDNYAVEEVNRDIKERIKRGFEAIDQATKALSSLPQELSNKSIK